MPNGRRPGQLRGSAWEPPDELRARGIDSFLVRNLAPAFESVLRFVQLNPRVLWSTAAEQIDLMYEKRI